MRSASNKNTSTKRQLDERTAHMGELHFLLFPRECVQDINGDDALEYIADMAEALGTVARQNNRTFLAHLLMQAGREARAECGRPIGTDGT